MCSQNRAEYQAGLNKENLLRGDRPPKLMNVGDNFYMKRPALYTKFNYILSKLEKLSCFADIVVDNCAICRNHIMDLCKFLYPIKPGQMCRTFHLTLKVEQSDLFNVRLKDGKMHRTLKVEKIRAF